MKANGAPEKLYYAPYGDIREDHPITDNDIEYIRKDAFIEKAVSWLEDNINEYTDGENIEFSSDVTFNIDVLFQEQLIEAFKKAMKL